MIPVWKPETRNRGKHGKILRQTTGDRKEMRIHQRR